MRARAVGTLVVLCLVGMAACGPRRGTVTTAADQEPSPTPTSPFLVEGVPDGFRLEVAGRGTSRQEWGGDSAGSDEPFTVLAPPGADPGGDEAVIVSVTRQRHAGGTPHGRAAGGHAGLGARRHSSGVGHLRRRFSLRLSVAGRRP